jgi:two-component system sensor histidine kinase UhpB
MAECRVDRVGKLSERVRTTDRKDATGIAPLVIDDTHQHDLDPRRRRVARGGLQGRPHWRRLGPVPRFAEMRQRFASMSLIWRVFAVNAAVLGLATAALALGPFTVSVPIELTELVVLIAGLVAMLVLNRVFLRPAFQPLYVVADAMRRVDPLEPGERVPVVGGPHVAALAQTFNEMLERLERERRESARQALIVQEAERQRVARELHDEVGQTLTAMMLQIESLAPKIPADLRDELDELRETTRTGAEDVRRIAKRLRPEALEELGLQSALGALTTSFSQQAAVPVERRLEPVAGLTEEQELVVYRVAQEALTNIARHANATRAEVSLTRRDGAVVLTVRDDGQGLPPGALSSSNGIRGMRERAMLIGARIAIGRASGRGTEIALHVPIKAS